MWQIVRYEPTDLSDWKICPNSTCDEDEYQQGNTAAAGRRYAPRASTYGSGLRRAGRSRTGGTRYEVRG
ncbi:hypothetical protein [Streptomyces sp. NBC_01429]|uniref:hypothetical protein n=1 Tax=Streptomyces sp. NBC_01429 TaxID=2903862 RepID=UPI002E2C1138|nr:hypothetical protein [Streptomyces sp. NBC_01429]